MLTSSAKDKGRNLQKYVATVLQELLNLHPDDCKSTSMGAQGCDVQLSVAAQEKLPVAIECKSYAKIAVYNWWKQAVSNTKKNQYPMLVIKQNHSNPLIVIDLDFFKYLIEKK